MDEITHLLTNYGPRDFWLSAELASRWSKISCDELIEACKIGKRLPEILRCVLKDEDLSHRM